MDVLPLSSIQVGSRARKDMGDLQGLADSIKRHGLLHPVVVKSDNTLVAGHRRIEAIRLLGLDVIPVTVIDVTDLLSAERDENAERKDFTPTEAVAIGLMIEEVEFPKAQERKSRLISEARRNNEIGSEVIPSQNPRTYQVAAKAVGMGGSQYRQAKAVVIAAETDPENFGDLPEQMDTTGNVSGAHREMKSRQSQKAGNGKTARHAMFKKMHYPKPNREMQRAVFMLDGLCTVLELVKPDQLDQSKTAEWAEAFKKSASVLNRTARRIVNV